MLLDNFPHTSGTPNLSGTFFLEHFPRSPFVDNLRWAAEVATLLRFTREDLRDLAMCAPLSCLFVFQLAAIIAMGLAAAEVVFRSGLHRKNSGFQGSSDSGPEPRVRPSPIRALLFNRADHQEIFYNPNPKGAPTHR